MKILVVDDNSNDRQILRQTIEAHGHEVLVAGGGEEGLRLAVHNLPDLIISDVFMPGMDGFQFLRTLKRFSAIPFIFYSAVYQGKEEVELARALGAECFLAKPKDPLELWHEIAQVLETGVRQRQESHDLVEKTDLYLKRYSEVVAAKLEEKVAELEVTEADRQRVAEDYRAILRTAMDGFLLVDYEGRVMDANDSYCRMTGYQRDELLRMRLPELDVVDTEEDVARRISDIRLHGSGRFETRHRRKDGTLIDVDVSVHCLPNSGGRLVSFLRDITEKKTMEKELFEAKRMEIIGHLAGGVAHEVRNPLNAILSISEALFREKDFAGNQEYLPYLAHIRAQIGRLSKLMNDLLDLGKPIPASSITDVSLPRFCNETVAIWKASPAAGKHQVNLVCDLDEQGLEVSADEARLQQVLINLLDNAAQSSPEATSITLEIGRAPEGRVALRVRDAGRGVAEEKLERIFEPFFTSRREGTGLGLALVKQFVENMGGEVRIFNNVPPPGCTAEVVLRRALKGDLQ
ncbi:hypothetical protein GMSM_08300 [Geomonas sp. Red276]